MTNPCTRWMALSDRAALGEALAPSERAFCTEHVLSCAECAREHALYGELATLVDPAPVVAQRPVRRRGWAWAGLAAAAALLFVSLRAESTGARLSEGARLEVEGEPLRVGDSLAVGVLAVARERACLTVDPGVRACFSAGSTLRAARLDARERRLELIAGKVLATLEPQPAGSSFGIVTREGSAIAVGTVFSVEVPARGEIITRVLHGVVSVQNRAGEQRRVVAHEKTAMHGPTTELSTLDEAHELTLSTGAPVTGSSQPDLPAAPALAVRKLDTPKLDASKLNAPKLDAPKVDAPARDAPTFAIPVSRTSAAQVAAAAHPVEASRARSRPLQPPPAPEELAEVVAVDVPSAASSAPAATPPATEPAVEVPPAQPPAPVVAQSPPEARPSVPRLSARELLLSARERTAHGDRPRALALYRQLVATAPESAEAKVAWVPYGELLLARGQARGALSAFEHYLALHGPLAEEASYGRIRALRALHDTRAEQRAVESFLRDYPDSVLAASLRTAAAQ
jgi:hypothetical protein